MYGLSWYFIALDAPLIPLIFRNIVLYTLQWQKLH